MISFVKISQKVKRVTAWRFSGVFLAFLFLFVNAQPAHAGYWGESIASVIMKQTMENIQTAIQGAVLGTLKVAATEVVNSQINQLIGGTSAGNSLIISDFDDFLNRIPEQNTELFMNDFFTLTTRGKGSTANYIGVGDIPGTMASSYTSYLIARAKSVTTEKDASPQYDLDEYTSSPDELFKEGDFRAVNAFVSHSANNPLGYALNAEIAYQETLARERESQSIKAQASGFAPNEVDGKIVTPAGTIQDLVSNVKNLGNDLIANASNPTELLSGVVVATVNRTVNTLIQTGVGKVQSNIRREIRSVDNQVSGAVNTAIRSTGPAAGIVNQTLKQRTSVQINPNTPPPPNPLIDI